MTTSGTFSTPRRPAAPALARDGRDHLRAVRFGSCAAVVAAALLQLLFFPEVEGNVPSVLFALAASLLGLVYALTTERFAALPVSAAILLLYTVTSTAGALLVKTAEWSALADRLTVPTETFGVLFVVQIALVAADHFYLHAPPLLALRRWIGERWLVPLGAMRWPTDSELWLLGLMGCASVMLAGTDFESGNSFGMGVAVEKLIRAFGFLKYAPFLIPFRNALSGQRCRPRLLLLPLVAYLGLLIGISFTTNSRSTFADAMPTIALAVLFAQALGRVDLRRVSPSQIVTVVVLGALGMMLLSRIALAMVVARDFRYGVTTSMLVQTTIEAIFNTEWLNAAKAKMDTAVAVGNYSEEYVDSRFFARFLLTKFHDNMLYYFSLMGPDQIASYKAFMLDRLLATLPDPLLRLFGIAIDKQDLIASNGDYAVYIVDGWGLGSFKTGSLIGEAVGVFGLAFPLVIAACAVLLFTFYDALTLSLGPQRIVVAPLIILLIWNLCGTTAAFGLGAETVTAIPGGILRGLPQNVLVYAVAVWLVRQFTRLRGGGR